MQTKSILRFLRGYVYFHGIGGFPADFISSATAAGIDLTDTHLQGEEFFGGCQACDYCRLRPLARRAGLHLHILRKSGVYFKLFPYRRRIGLPIGAILAGILLFTLSSRIWIVAPLGNIQLSDAEVLETVRAQGVYVGCRIDSVNMEELRILSLHDLPRAVYLSVNPHGCVARVMVKERADTPEIQNFKSTVSNLVATMDGKIISTDVHSGQAAVQVGDGVSEGMLLVSGTVESASGHIALRRAAGNIIAQTTRTLSFTVPFYETVKLPSDTPVFRPALRFLKWELPLFANTPLDGVYHVEEYHHLPHFRDLTVPLGVVHRYYTPMQNTDIQHTYDEALLLLEQQYAAAAAALAVDGVDIKEQLSRKTEKTDDGVTLTVTLRCHEDIAKEILLKTDESY